jgi:hypothetical protein
MSIGSIKFISQHEDYCFITAEDGVDHFAHRTVYSAAFVAKPLRR